MMTTPLSSADAAPARVLPLLYFLVGYVSLPLAFAAVAYAPRSLGGFYYHARLIGVVHLVTLGWITAAILGAVYLVLPLLLRAPLPPRRGDYWAFASFAIGLVGMVVHFWIEEFSGMAWSGLMVTVAVLHVGFRAVPPVLRVEAPAAVTALLVLAFANVGLAAAAGVVLGFDKVHHVLPGYVVANVLAHAHLAALGWACMMTLGLVYLVLPVGGLRQPPARPIVVTVVLLEGAALGLIVTLVLASRWSALFAALAAGVFARFLRDVVRIFREQPTADRPRPDVGGWHVAQGCAYLAVAVPLGVALAWMDASELTLRLAFVYGVCGLVGFLAQCLLGIQMRLVPLAWRANANRPCAVPAFVMWSLAVPLLALGFFIDSARLLSVAGAAACVATLASAVQGAFVIGSTRERRPWISWRRDRSRRRSASQQLAVPQGRR